MAPEKVSLTEEKATLLITLCARAGESRLPDSLLHDRFAAEAVNHIDYDFSKLKVGRDLMISVALRAQLLDGWTREFLGRHPNAVVLHLGCGLDSRVFRIAPPKTVHWFDVDYPEVIALRSHIYPEREGYTLVSASVTDPNWIEKLPANRPAMIIAEGLFMYLPEEATLSILSRLTAQFPSGEVAFDTFSRLGVWILKRHPSVRLTAPSMYGAFENPRAAELRIPKLKLLDDFTAYDPKGYAAAQIARMSKGARLAIRILVGIPPLSRISRTLHYSF